MYRPRVLLAEDHAETAVRLRKLLRADFDVIASVEDGDTLVNAAERLSPDVIVTDIAMPGVDGIEAITQIRRHNPNARIVLVTVHAELMLVEAGLAAGALGYILKDTAGDELVPAVRAALLGHQYVSRELDGFDRGAEARERRQEFLPKRVE
jgi:DNA-binding NarL/FixJ family response regulator